MVAFCSIYITDCFNSRDVNSQGGGLLWRDKVLHFPKYMKVYIFGGVVD